jgi:hypothetical protein
MSVRLHPTMCGWQLCGAAGTPRWPPLGNVARHTKPPAKLARMAAATVTHYHLGCLGAGSTARHAPQRTVQRMGCGHELKNECGRVVCAQGSAATPRCTACTPARAMLLVTGTLLFSYTRTTT